MINCGKNNTFGRLVGSLIALTSLVILSTGASADFTLFSQNALHLGYNSKAVNNYIPNKYDYFKRNISNRYDLVLYQEVMRQADPAQVIQGAVQSYPTPQMIAANGWLRKGTDRYKEAYLTTYDPGNINLHCYVNLTNQDFQPYGGTELIRPPDLMLISSNKQNARRTWIMNFHAIFGDGPNDRVDEATAIRGFILADLVTTAPNNLYNACPGNQPIDRVIIAGDWNLTDQELRGVFAAPFNVTVAGLTSITPDGHGSSNYDHFVGHNVAFNGAARIFNPADAQLPVQPGQCSQQNGGQYCWFRENVSDHLGVYVNVRD